MARKILDPTQQHVIHRSFLFVTLPAIILCLLGLNFLWEVIRANVGQSTRASWPLRFVLLDMSPTAALLGVATGLFLTRLQWAKANRPTIGYAIADDGEKFVSDSSVWSVWLSNGGPGIGIVEEFSYVVKFANQPRSVPASLEDINQAMRSRGLRDGADYFVRKQGKGLAYPPSSAHPPGTMICWFSIKALAELDEFNIVVRLRDSLGDAYQITLVICENLPTIAAIAKADYLASRSTST